jgi:hypothetical protein
MFGFFFGVFYLVSPINYVGGYACFADEISEDKNSILHGCFKVCNEHTLLFKNNQIPGRKHLKKGEKEGGEL